MWGGTAQACRIVGLGLVTSGDRSAHLRAAGHRAAHSAHRNMGDKDYEGRRGTFGQPTEAPECGQPCAGREAGAKPIAPHLPRKGPHRRVRVIA